MKKQERNDSDWVSVKTAADHLCVSEATVRLYHKAKTLRGRQRVPRGRIDFQWGKVVKFGRGIDQN